MAKHRHLVAGFTATNSKYSNFTTFEHFYQMSSQHMSTACTLTTKSLIKSTLQKRRTRTLKEAQQPLATGEVAVCYLFHLFAKKYVLF